MIIRPLLNYRSLLSISPTHAPLSLFHAFFTVEPIKSLTVPFIIFIRSNYLLISLTLSNLVYSPPPPPPPPPRLISDEMDQLLAKISELTLLNKGKDEQRDEGLSEASKRVTHFGHPFSFLCVSYSPLYPRIPSSDLRPPRPFC